LVPGPEDAIELAAIAEDEEEFFWDLCQWLADVTPLWFGGDRWWWIGKN
jgi:hypothetical protein